MSKMEFLDPKETEKFKKQKRVQFCRTLACSKKTKFLNFILQLCPGLCIYVKNHQKKFQDFWGHSFGPPLILRFSISTFMRRRRRSLLRTFLGVLDSCSVAEWPGNLILIYFEYSGLSVHQKLTELHNAVICNNDYYPIVL